MSDWRDEVRNPNCKECSLHQEAQHVCLLGDGNLNADIVIVGEAPGQREDEEHRAFVGPAGKLLDELLKEAGIERKDVYITNAAKCRPPQNATPSRKEIKICSGTYLAQELAHIKPTWVLTMGNSALVAMTGRSGIKKHTGSVHKKNGYKIFATYHPAAVLRNPSLRGQVQADLARFVRMTKGQPDKTGTTKVTPILTPPRLKWLIEQLSVAEEISYDIETYTRPSEDDKYIRTNFQDWHGPDSMIVSISFSWKEGHAAVLVLNHKSHPWAHPDRVLAKLKPVMERKDCKYIAQNGKFDDRWLHAKGINSYCTFDTMLAAHLLDENRTKGLKPLAQLLLGASDWGEDTKNAYEMPLRKLLVYNAKDTDYTLRLYHIFRDELKKQPRLARLFMRLTMPASRALTDIEAHGVYMDQERWKERCRTATRNTNKAFTYLNEWAREADPDRKTALNPNSPKQLADVMFNHLELDIVKLTKTGAPSTDESVLLQLAHVHPFADGLLKYRKWAKYLSTYLLPWQFEHQDYDSRIRSSYRITGTTTGRLSGEGGIQQVPRDKFIRSLIGSPPGWKFVEADMSQIELRAICLASSDKHMKRAFLKGEDLHTRTALQTISPHDQAALMAMHQDESQHRKYDDHQEFLRTLRDYDVPPNSADGAIAYLSAADLEDAFGFGWKEVRKKAKATNFGFSFGMSAKKFVTYARDNYGVDMSLKEAEHFRKSFFDAYPKLEHWHNRQRRLVNRYGHVTNPIGRVRRLPDVFSGDREVQAEAERQAINSPIQSFASDLVLMALIILHRKLDDSEAYIVGTVHDSILFNVREDCIDKICPIIKHTMENPPMHWWGRDKLEIPIEVDIVVGDHWGEGSEWRPR